MPILTFKGKSSIWNHHQSPNVPFYTLKQNLDLSYNSKAQNLTNITLLEADNLVGLKALLPKYGGKVKCIYIDPPYNTGNESWVYSDNVSSPMIAGWLGQTVGKDDLTKHDKWLCMMTPRLKLLREMMSQDGVIFVSIDDNEVHHLRMLMDEIWGEENFINELIWKKRGTGGMVKDGAIISQTESVLIYAKNKPKSKINKLENENQGSEKWRDFRKSGGQWQKSFRPNQHYPFYYDKITQELTLEKISDEQIIIYPQDSNLENGYWANGLETGKERLQKGDFKVEQNKSGQWLIKQLETAGETENLGNFIEIPSTRAIIDLKNLDINNFETPKPLDLIKHILKIGTDKDSIVMDSFAGSGTTGQAVMELNAQDGGNRKVVLVQMPENESNICKSITRERLVRASAKKNLGLELEYLQLGANMDKWALLSADSDDQLPSFEDFGEFLLGSCLGIKKQVVNNGTATIFEGDNFVVCMIYRADLDFLSSSKSAISLEFAESLKQKYGPKLKKVFATSSYLDQDELADFGIEYINLISY